MSPEGPIPYDDGLPKVLVDEDQGYWDEEMVAVFRTAVHDRETLFDALDLIAASAPQPIWFDDIQSVLNVQPNRLRAELAMLSVEDKPQPLHGPEDVANDGALATVRARDAELPDERPHRGMVAARTSTGSGHAHSQTFWTADHRA